MGQSKLSFWSVLSALGVACGPGAAPSSPQSTETTPHGADGADGTDGADGADGGDGSDGGGDSGGDTGAPDPRFDALRAAVLDDINHSRSTGASVAIYHHGELIFAEGFGSAHPDRDEPVGVNTLFAIGSDTKKITAIAALQQAARGRLDLDAPLTATLPALALARSPDWAAETTLHELLSHQGGLWDFTPWYDAPEDSALAAITYGDVAAEVGAMAPGGAMWNYSNPNFSLAGLATEQADGRPWADIVEEDIFAPLGLSRTFARQASVEADGDYASGTGYTFTESWDSLDPWQSWSTEAEDYTFGTVEMADSADNGFTRPAGMVWSTATDMARLGDFLLRGDEAVLSELDRARITTAQVAVYPAFGADYTAYGYGLFISAELNMGDDYYATPIWSHGGNTLSQTSTFYVLPEQEFVLSILSNGYGDDFGGSVVAAFTTLAGLPEPVEAPPLPMEPDPLDTYAGVYFDPITLGEITISAEGESLKVDAPVLTEHGIAYKRTLTPVAADLFMMSIASVDYDLTFIDGADGTPNQYVRNRGFVGTRQPPGLTHARPSRPATPGAPPAAAGVPALDPIPALLRLPARPR